MIGSSPPEVATDPERLLSLTYTPVASRPAVSALFQLDDRLAMILRTTREPIVGQMRLTWWHEALSALDTAPAPAEPVLRALAQHVLPTVAGATLATMVEGWEALLDAEIGDDALRLHADMRGGGLFGAIAALVGADDADARAIGRGWALADVALHLSAPALVDKARAMARAALAEAPMTRWSPSARVIAALAQTARMDVAESPRPHGHPVRTSRLLWARLTGR